MAENANTPAPPPRRVRRRLVVLCLIALVLLVAAEVVGRLVLRLGDPPLYVAHPQIEYLMAPSARYERFYAVSTYNRWSMRNTPDIEKTKASPAERRILIMGDSVVNGGPQTDDAQLATTLLPARLGKSGPTGAAPVVANISCGSWGPPNLLAYARTFGLFQADVVVIVLNHEDAADVPTFAPLGKELPTRKPVLALEEALFRYIPSWLETKFGSAAAPVPRSPEQLALDMDACEKALRELIALIRGSNARVAVVLHTSRPEARGEMLPGTLRLRSICRDLGVPVRDTSQAMQEALRSGVQAYRDDIHLNPQGQPLLSEVLAEAVAAAGGP